MLVNEHWACLLWVKNKFCRDSNDFGFIFWWHKHHEQFQETCSPILLELPVWLQTCYHNEKLSVELSDCLLETYSLTSYGNGWRKDVVNRSLEFGIKHDLQ